MSTNAATLTEFLRRPKQVLLRVDKQDVVLVRRGGKPAIRLSLESRALAASSGIEIAADLLADAVLAVPEVPDRLAELLKRRFPWVRLLPLDARVTFVREFVETLQACASVRNPSCLDELLGDWKATAAVYADSALAAELHRPLPGTSVRVHRPARAKKR